MWKYFLDGVQTDLSLSLNDPTESEYRGALCKIKDTALAIGEKLPNELVFMIVHVNGYPANLDNYVVWIGEEEKIYVQNDLLKLLDKCPNLRIMLVHPILQPGPYGGGGESEMYCESERDGGGSESDVCESESKSVVREEKLSKSIVCEE